MPSRRTHLPLELWHAAHLVDIRPAAQVEVPEASLAFSAGGSR